MLFWREQCKEYISLPFVGLLIFFYIQQVRIFLRASIQFVLALPPNSINAQQNKCTKKRYSKHKEYKNQNLTN